MALIQRYLSQFQTLLLLNQSGMLTPRLKAQVIERAWIVAGVESKARVTMEQEAESCVERV